MRNEFYLSGGGADISAEVAEIFSAAGWRRVVGVVVLWEVKDIGAGCGVGLEFLL